MSTLGEKLESSFNSPPATTTSLLPLDLVTKPQPDQYRSFWGISATATHSPSAERYMKVLDGSFTPPEKILERLLEHFYPFNAVYLN